MLVGDADVANIAQFSDSSVDSGMRRDKRLIGVVEGTSVITGPKCNKSPKCNNI